jgi:hypothetical protein
MANRSAKGLCACSNLVAETPFSLRKLARLLRQRQPSPATRQSYSSIRKRR